MIYELPYLLCPIKLTFFINALPAPRAVGVGADGGRGAGRRAALLGAQRGKGPLQVQKHGSKLTAELCPAPMLP